MMCNEVVKDAQTNGWLAQSVIYCFMLFQISYQDGYRLVTVHTHGDFIVFVGGLFDGLATSKFISEWVPTSDSAHS